MGSKRVLSQVLLEMGFFCALGTTEDPHGDQTVVGYSMANTCDRNNGVVVIYDETGRPWIMPTSHNGLVVAVTSLIVEFSLRKGAYVPHSNDGGYFVYNVLPYLRQKAIRPNEWKSAKEIPS
jgi:hypothetical protein